MIGEPSDQSLRRARDEFASLIGQRTPESLWQRFFAHNPFVLSRGLPVRLLPCDILPLGRPGRSEPDFLLHPGSAMSGTIHGLVELKTDYAKIASHPRKTEIILSRDAATAISQLDTYDALYDSFAPTKRILTLDTLSHLFVIMGSQSELNAIASTLLPKLFNQIPPGVRFLTFNDLFDRFSGSVPKQVALLQAVPTSLPPLSWTADTRDFVSAGLTLFRLVSEPYFFAGDTSASGFAQHVDRLFSRPPVASGRFSPLDRSVLYAVEKSDDALQEMQRRSLPKLAAFRGRRFGQIEFKFTGRVLDVQPNTLTEAVMQSRDLDAAATIAREAQTSGFAAIAYRPEATTGRHFAILERASIGAPVSFRSFEE